MRAMPSSAMIAKGTVAACGVPTHTGLVLRQPVHKVTVRYNGVAGSPLNIPVPRRGAALHQPNMPHRDYFARQNYLLPWKRVKNEQNDNNRNTYLTS